MSQIDSRIFVAIGVLVVLAAAGCGPRAARKTRPAPAPTLPPLTTRATDAPRVPAPPTPARVAPQAGFGLPPKAPSRATFPSAPAPTPRHYDAAHPTGQRVKRTGLHPGLFDEYGGASGWGEEVVEEPLPATPTPYSGPARTASLQQVIARTTAPNIAAALRLIDRGREEFERGDVAAALDSLERGVAIDPSNFYGYYYLAEAHFSRRDYAQAVGFANRAAVLTGPGEPGWRGRIYALQGKIFEEAGRYPDAREAYAMALEADPGNVAARVGQSRLGGGPPAERQPAEY